MSFIDFIQAHHPAIIDRFEAVARTLAPAAASISPAELRDHAEELLAAIVDDLGEMQTVAEHPGKSQGPGVNHAIATAGSFAAAPHIAHRFSAHQVISEFSALRASVLRLYADDGGEVDLPGVERFNGALDTALAASVERFSDRVDVYQTQFIGMLSHDLRAPLSAITAGAALLTQSVDVEAQRVRVASRILSSAQRMTRMLADLLDLTRTRLGSGIPIARRPTDLQRICEEVALECQAAHPNAALRNGFIGDLRGEWDADRLSQVVSNLIGNAVEHGDGTLVSVMAHGATEEVRLTVHNHGPSIPEQVQASLFEPLTRYAPTEGSNTTSIGLGLFIARAVVVAHGGTITVSSTEEAGTTFEVRLPRRNPSPPAPEAGECYRGGTTAHG